MQSSNRQYFLGMLEAIHGKRLSMRVFVNKMRKQLAINDAYITSPEVPCEAKATLNCFDAIEGCGRSLCFIAPHWGNYAMSFERIAFSLPQDSRFIALRANQWGEKEDAFWRRINTRSGRADFVKVFRADEKRNMISLLRDMKQGAHLFALFDLFAEFGETSPVNIFGNEVNLTMGWSKLCYMADAVVISVAPVSLEREEIQIFDVVDPREFRNRDEFVRRCTVIARRSLEGLLREQPAFWFMWEHWEKYQARAIDRKQPVE
ncbi:MULTISPECIES: hypothetical protein [unclassified Ensifer]|uniref:hypothetical protein n=1 Tax=unclassified Ensifer TaxID=2633371 RepID=UPI00300FD600